MNELRSRGLNDILIAVVDGLKGFPDAITSVYPDTVVQTCIVHLIRNSLQLASWKDRKMLAAALKPIYQADNVDAAEQALSDFEQGDWGQRFPTIAQSWRRHWEHIIPFFAFAAPVRKIIYTTNAIESLHSSVRKTIRNKGHFPNDERPLNSSGSPYGISPPSGRIRPSPGRMRRHSSRYNSQTDSTSAINQQWLTHRISDTTGPWSPRE